MGVSEHAALPATKLLPNLPRYGRRHKAGIFGAAKYTTVILYGSKRSRCLPSLHT